MRFWPRQPRSEPHGVTLRPLPLGGVVPDDDLVRARKGLDSRRRREWAGHARSTLEEILLAASLVRRAIFPHDGHVVDVEAVKRDLGGSILAQRRAKASGEVEGASWIFEGGECKRASRTDRHRVRSTATAQFDRDRRGVFSRVRSDKLQVCDESLGK